jgi:thiopurine S-methyltransferase
MQHPIYNLKYWRARWTTEPAKFSGGRPDGLLATHWPSLGVPLGSRVLVPLAGKSPDLAWLASHGFDVVGVEVSPVACEEFFAERNVTAERMSDGPFVRWQGGGVTLLQGDFFALDGTFDAALDRGALVALPPEIRPGYAELLHARLVPAGPLLLVTIEYDPRRRNGPPFPVFPDEVRRLFPAAVERARRPLLRARWDPVGGAESVVWVARIGRDGFPPPRG